MNTISSFVQRYSLLTFFALAYGFSWGSYYLLSAPFLFPLGSILSALIVASVTGGRNGLKDLLSRCLRWNVGLKWYAAALVLALVAWPFQEKSSLAQKIQASSAEV
jgi:hypothetical protein